MASHQDGMEKGKCIECGELLYINPETGMCISCENAMLRQSVNMLTIMLYYERKDAARLRRESLHPKEKESA